MTARILGILGGMGPEATLDFYREVIRLTPASSDQDHIPVLIYSSTKIPDRTAAILGSGEDPLPPLIESARLLERAGAGIIAIPCNTAHHYLPRIREQISIPVLDMIGETRQALEHQYPGLCSVGLLATTATLAAGLYQSALQPVGITLLMPPEPDQDRVMAAVRDVKAGRPLTRHRRTLGGICLSLQAAGAKAVILGCTELPLVFGERPTHLPILNPTRVLAQAAVNWALAERR